MTAVALVGTAFRNFGDFLSLMGWFAFGVQGFLAPAAMHLVLFRRESAPSTRWLNWAIVVVGAALIVFGTTNAVKNLAHGRLKNAKGDTAGFNHHVIHT